ncbi:MAG TPA: hypothetical protein VFF60_11955 [Candidatus Binatus sp.]|nr:hypothetical protein [Candidatus Binatus sp.]
MKTISGPVAAVVVGLLVVVAVLFLVVLFSMNAKLAALDRMTTTLDHMDRGLAETNRQLMLANRALSYTDQELDASLHAAQRGDQYLVVTTSDLQKTQTGINDMRVTLRDLDAQITQLTNRIKKSHLLGI